MKTTHLAIVFFFLLHVAAQAQNISYELIVESTLTPYVGEDSQLPPGAEFDTGDKLASLAHFKIKNNFADPIYVRVKAGMHRVGGRFLTPSAADFDSEIIKIVPGETINFEDVGVELDAAEEGVRRYVVSMTYRISLSPEMEPLEELATGGWANHFNLRREE